MPLIVHRAPRTDALATALAELLATPAAGADPFADELVVVPARGVERWLSQRLSHRLGVGERGGDGVCAGIRFLSPRSLVGAVLGPEQDDPWEPGRLVWPVLEAIDAHLDADWARPLARHLGALELPDDPPGTAEIRRGRRWSVARHLASLFASYAKQRPDLLAGWCAGRDDDGIGDALDEDLLWQSALFRAVAQRIDAPAPHERHADAVARLRSGIDDLDLPGRVSLFGHTRLPAAELDLLEAMGAHRDVHLWLPVASPALARRLERSHAALRRADDRSARDVRHPLLAALGRDARELQTRLAGIAGVRFVDLGEQAEPDPSASVLALLQADIRADRVPSPEEVAERTPGAADTSVQVHACHGPARQVEVLREVLLGLLADDPTLEPRDVLVMCPDIETYAPLIEAGFGLADPAAERAEGASDDRSDLTAQHPAHQLRVRLADRALSSVNPLLALAERLVVLAGSRVSASEVLDLAAQPVVRRRFGFDDDALARVERWVQASGVRWGIDPAHRRLYALESVPQNTWRAGLDRVLLGAAMAGQEETWVGSALPLDDVGSNEVDLAGRVAELVDRLAAALDGLREPAAASHWAEHLAASVASLAAVAPRDAWQSAELDRELARLVPKDGGAAISLADLRAMLGRQWGGRPTRSGFRTGTLTVSTLVPMRSVPHRVVCLLGVDDGVFPRSTVIDGDDVLARDPLIGERDTRSEDRQLLLDALMSATDHFVVVYTGAGEHTGGQRPPAVPIGELLTAVEATASLVRSVVVRHPLQPFDAANLVDGDADPRSLVPEGRPPFSFDAAALAGAQAQRGERTPLWPLVRAPLEPRNEEVVELDDLVAFLVHPMKAFLRSRLDVSTRFDADEVADAIPIQLDGLGKWGVGDRLLGDALLGIHPSVAVEAERRRAQLPPRALGAPILAEAERRVRELYTGTMSLRAGEPRSLDVEVDLGDGRRLVGLVDGLHGGNLVSVTYSSIRAKQRISAWVRLLALSAAHPDRSFVAHTVGRGGRDGARRALAGPLDDRALDWLKALIDVRDRGLCAPLPLPLSTGLAVAEAMARHRSGDDESLLAVARKEWQNTPSNLIPGECADAAHTLLLGEDAPVEDFFVAPGADETWESEREGYGFRTRIGQYAWRVWGPLVTGAEKVGPL